MAVRRRILFLIGSMIGGGSERQLLEILRRIDRSSFQPLLYTVYREGELLPHVPADVPVHAYWDRHTFPRWNFPGRILQQQCHDMADLFAREKVDVVCDRNFNVTLLAAGACRRWPTPRVSIVSADPAWDLRANANRFFHLKRLLLARAYRTADRVVAVSEGVLAGVRDFYRLPQDSLVTIPNLIGLAEIEHRAAEFDPPMEPERFHVVTAGRLQPQKGHTYLLQAMSELVHRRGQRQLVLWILGQGPLERELRDQVTKEELDDFVRFTGYQPNPLPYVRQAQLFCLPSLYEGLPNALAEAMALRTPVLAADCPSGPRELLGDGEFGRLVPPAEPHALAEAVEDAIRNHARWREVTARARTHLEQNFSAEIGIAKYEALFAEVLANHDRRV
jgi:glycosyltransferase involved in cell wall biosynthesis